MPDENNRSVTNEGDANNSILASGDHNVTLKDNIINGTRNVVKVITKTYNIALNGIISHRMIAIFLVLFIPIAIHYLGHDFSGLCDWYRKKQVIDDHLSSAKSLLEIGQHYQAESDYQKVIELDKENPNARLGLLIIETFRILEGNAPPDLFEKKIQQILNQDAQNPYAYLLSGHFHSRSQNIEAARQKYEKVIKIAPYIAESYFGMGFLYLRQKDFDKAFEMYDKARTLSPSNSRYLINLAYLYLKTGQYQKSLDIYAEILEKDRDFILAYCEMAIVYRKMEKFEIAIDALKKALEKIDDPEIQKHPQNKADWSFEFDNDYIYLSEINDKKCYILYSLAVTSALLNRNEEAEKYQQQARALNAKNEDSVKALMNQEAFHTLPTL
jgi:tetratricopeptide (TPR) repeat protein